MGAIAEAYTAFAQPLIDATDGSLDQLNRAVMLAQICWNCALRPEHSREDFLAAIRSSLNMNDDEFEDLKSSVVIPMVRRHEEMFPNLHRGRLKEFAGESQEPQGKFPGTGRNVPCPCHSGRKYKACCGRP